MSVNNQINALAKELVLKFLDEDDPRFLEETRLVSHRITKLVIDLELIDVHQRVN